MTTLEHKPSLSLSEMAVQMENLLHALIPFKRQQFEKLKEHKEADIIQTSQWWDKMIANVEQELAILKEHAAALGIEIKLVQQTETTTYENGEKLESPKTEIFWVSKEEDERQ